MASNLTAIKAGKRRKSSARLPPKHLSNFTLPPALLFRQSLACDSWKFEAFVAKTHPRPRSARLYREVVKSARRQLRKAWYPLSMYSLSSRSSHLLVETNKGSPWEAEEDGAAVLQGFDKKEFGRTEDHIALEDLVKLHEKFQEADIDGNGTLDIDEFVSTFDSMFHLERKNEEEIMMFFNKIDFDCDGAIDWDEFCTYMYLEYQEREDAKNTIMNVEFQLPAETMKASPHRDSICSINYLLDGSIVSCSQDGVICLWGLDNKPKRVKKAESGLTGKPKWVTDMALCIPQNKILVTTGEHEIQFYEIMNFEPYCQLRRLEAMPLKLHFWSNPARVDECCILIGDKEGTLTVLSMDNIQEAFKYWKLAPKIENGMPTYSIDRLVVDRIAGTNFYRWKLHTNWVTEVQYFGKLRCFASCSCDPVNSIVLGSPAGSTPVDALLHGVIQMMGEDDKDHTSSNQDAAYTASKRRTMMAAKNRHVGDQRIFSVSKGVTTIKYCPKNNLMVTGGLDQIIRIWNPFITGKPVANLYGQGSPVFGIQIDGSEHRIFSIGNDNIIKVWNLADHSCMLTLIPSAHKVTSPVEYFFFNPVHNFLVVASDHLSLLKTLCLKGGRSDIIQSHLRPVTAVRYSHCFNQIVTSCEGAMMKVWDISTGKKMFEFSANLGENVTISSMDVDKSGKRIVTGGDNGKIQVWNYNNGQCIRVLDKGTDKETSDIKFITLNENKYIIAVGWDRELYLFADMVTTHMEHCIHPIPDWSKASSKVHTEDILCIAVGHPNLMATSSYDGEIVLWSVISCHMLAKLVVPKTNAPSNAVQEDSAINKILFLDKRSSQVKTSATLVSSGPDGKIHFWNVYNVQAPIGAFYVHGKDTCVTDMAVDGGNNILTAVDASGYVTIFDITYFCLNSEPKSGPKKLSHWKAHTRRITSVLLVDQWSTVVTGSSDGAVRIWTIEGQHIGTFGQDTEWRLGDPLTYHYPDVLRDILYDDDDFMTAVNRSRWQEGEEVGLLANRELEADELEETLGSKPAAENGVVLNRLVVGNRSSSSISSSSSSDRNETPTVDETANKEVRKKSVETKETTRTLSGQQDRIPTNTGLVTSENRGRMSRPVGGARMKFYSDLQDNKMVGRSPSRNVNMATTLTSVSSTRPWSNSILLDKESVISQIKVPSPGSAQVGKRLRHLRTHSAAKKDETKSKRVYANLKYFPLADDEVKINKPVFGLKR